MKLTVRIIAETVAEHYSVTYRELLSIRKTVAAAEARMVTYWLARQFTALSLPQIGRALGDRDHSTIHAGIRAIDERRGTRPALFETLGILQLALQSIERAMARANLTPPGDVDPLAVAWRIMVSDRDTIAPAKDEILALAIAVIGAEHEAQSQQQNTPTAEEPTHV
jgi:hypothetical protein